jgi:acylglycerol lipase
MSHTEFSWKSANGLKIYAQAWAPAEARGVVAIVHGLGEHSGRYAHVAEVLNQAGFALMGFDLPGHGRSDGTRGHTSFPAVAAEIDTLLETARSHYPGKPCFLYGHSLGGALVLYYLLKCRPEIQGVVATSPALGVGTPVPTWKRYLARTMARVYPSFLMPNGLDRQNLCRDRAVIEAYSADPLVHDRISALLGNDLLTTGAWTIENAASISIPLLVVQGSADQLVSPEAVKIFAEAVPADKITYKAWEGFYHETHNEPEKDKVLQFMIDWLNRHV